jgi:ribose-phosphate pyrophosphokinase
MSAATLSWSVQLGGVVGGGQYGRGGQKCKSKSGASSPVLLGSQRAVVESGGRCGQRRCAAVSANLEASSSSSSDSRSSRGLRLRAAAIVDKSSAAAESDAAEEEAAAEAAVTLDEVVAAGAAMAAVTTTATTVSDECVMDHLNCGAGGPAGAAEAMSNAGAATGPAAGAAAGAVSKPLGGVRPSSGRSGLLGCDRVGLNNVTTAALPRLNRLNKGSKFPVLFYAPEMEDLAKKIVAEEVGESAVELGDIDWRTFPDGFPDLFVNDAYGVRDRHVAFLASFHSPEVIFEQISIIYSLPKMFVASFTLILPFFPTGTSERVEREGEIATAVTLARILSNIPPSRGGPCSTLIFDIHALQERFYFGDNILPCFESGIPLLLNRLAQCEDAENIVIAYPDEGAWKRFHGFFKGMEEVVCTKVRDGDKRMVKLKEGEPAGRHVVIVDDLVQSGGTLIECQKLLSRLGAVKVSAYCTHGVFPGNSWKRFTASSGAGGQGFHKFFLTDSCPGTVKAVEGTEPFEILSLARPIAEALHI